MVSPAMDNVAKHLIQLRSLTHTLFKNGFQSGLYSDVQVKAFGTVFHLHRLVLIQNPYFECLLQGSFIESTTQDATLHLSFDDVNITLAGLVAVFERMYGKTSTRFHVENATSILATALYFQDSALATDALGFIQETLGWDTLHRYLSFASHACYHHYSDRILDAIFTLLCRQGTVPLLHQEQSLLHQAYMDMSVDMLYKIVSSDCFYAPNEMDRFRFIRCIVFQRFMAHDSDTTALSDEVTCVEPLETMASPKHCIDMSLPLPPIPRQSHYTRSSVFSADKTESEQLKRVLNSSVRFDAMPLRYLLKLYQKRLRAKPDSLHALVDPDTVLKAIEKVTRLQHSIRMCREKEAVLMNEAETFRRSRPGYQHAVPTAARRFTPTETDIKDEEASDDDTFSTRLEELIKNDHDFPCADTSQIDAISLTHDIYLQQHAYQNVEEFQYYRFAFEINDVKRLETERKLLSNRVYYAGSYWVVYLQLIESESGPKLGIYLQRLAVDSANDFVDHRIEVTAWFKMYCFLIKPPEKEDEMVEPDLPCSTIEKGMRAVTLDDVTTQDLYQPGFQPLSSDPWTCFILESKPDTFKCDQSWGWRSQKLYEQALMCPSAESLRFCVTLGLL